MTIALLELMGWDLGGKWWQRLLNMWIGSLHQSGGRPKDHVYLINWWVWNQDNFMLLPSMVLIAANAWFNLFRPISVWSNFAHITLPLVFSQWPKFSSNWIDAPLMMCVTWSDSFLQMTNPTVRITPVEQTRANFYIKGESDIRWHWSSKGRLYIDKWGFIDSRIISFTGIKMPPSLLLLNASPNSTIQFQVCCSKRILEEDWTPNIKTKKKSCCFDVLEYKEKGNKSTIHIAA